MNTTEMINAVISAIPFNTKLDSILLKIRVWFFRTIIITTNDETLHSNGS